MLDENERDRDIARNMLLGQGPDWPLNSEIESQSSSLVTLKRQTGHVVGWAAQAGDVAFSCLPKQRFQIVAGYAQELVCVSDNNPVGSILITRHLDQVWKRG